MYTPKVTLCNASNSPEFAQISKDIEECEVIATNLMNELSDVDSSIAELVGNFGEISTGCFDFAENLLQGIDEKNIDKNRGRASIGAAAGALGLVVGAAGLAVGTVKHIKAKKAYNKKMDALLEEKQLIADEKLDSTVSFLKKMHDGVCQRMEDLYGKEFTKNVDCDDELLEAKTNLFKKSLGMVLKTRFLLSSIEYVVCEMRAWKKGKHDSEYVPKTARQLFEKELSMWPARFRSGNWELLMKKTVESGSNIIPVPMAFTLMDPVMLQTFGRIEFPFIDNDEALELDIDDEETVRKKTESDSILGGLFSTETKVEKDNSLLPTMFESEYTKNVTDDGKIKFSGSFIIPETPVKRIILNNPYYQKCDSILNSKYIFPQEPEGFGVGDLVVIAITAALIFAYYHLISYWLWGHNFFKWVFYLLPYSIVYGRYLHENYFEFGDIFTGIFECLKDLYDKYVSILPFSKRKKEHEKEVSNIVSEIQDTVNDITNKTINL